ncbi:histidine phosphatase family protein [Wohlfahrtiimonas larvae]|uniref:Histidine phosphatase family protein n=1 Tax=Wohlfahrtiimonas larvae TaxID=1157986 RepID=A0ABP9MTL6_9GAMM|nr:histidine phosphatase family protein [Wohlfahrtiimonas larvae]
MKELILIRHGEAEHLTNNLTGGWSDHPLTELGMQQAFKTAQSIYSYLLNNAHISLYSSDLIRAQTTAQQIQSHLKINQIHYHPGLRELNNGIAKNISIDDAKKLLNPITHPTLDWIPYQNGESWRMLNQRIDTTMEEIHSHTHDDTVIIISHANAIICMIHWWLNIKEDHHLTNIMYSIDPCSITHLIQDKHGCLTIKKLNDTSHLK